MRPQSEQPPLSPPHPIHELPPEGVDDLPPLSAAERLPSQSASYQPQQSPPENVNDLPLLGFQSSERHRERIRGVIVYWLLCILSGIICLGFGSFLWVKPDSSAIEKLLIIIFGPVVTLLSTALGFYFGGTARSQESATDRKTDSLSQ